MARQPRLCVPGQPHHVLMRGVGAELVFADEADRAAFVHTLLALAPLHALALHGWALMPDHVHLLLTPAHAAGLSAAMQALARRHTQAFNRRHGRRGTLWEGRYRSTVLQADRWLLPAMVWVDTHPLRNGLCTLAQLLQAPGHPWVSAGHYLGLHSQRGLSVPMAYWALGNTPFAREAAYRTLLEQGCTPEVSAALTRAALKGWALGEEPFVAALQAQCPRRLSPARAGRPRRTPG